MEHQVAVPRTSGAAVGSMMELPVPDGADLPAGHRRPTEQPRHEILIASTCWWAFPARIAMAFASAGFRVAAICPRGHPLLKTRAVHRHFPYRALDPIGALVQAIGQSNPKLLVPCDDRALGHMQALHARLVEGNDPKAGVIEQSLGNRESFAITAARAELIRIAREEGIRAPEMLRVDTVTELRVALERLGLPAVLKLDGTWGGLGVAIVHSPAQAETAFRAMSQPLGATRALKRVIVDRDAFSLLPWIAGARPTVNVQQFVPGRPANCAAACWFGELLAVSSVEVVRAHSDLGASTVVRAIDNQEVVDVTKRLVRRLRLSGFCGLDFQMDNTGNFHLLELNARSTPLCHLALGKGRNPLQALAKRIAGANPVPDVPAIEARTIAFFPQAWRLQPDNVFLQSGYHDVPWSEPDLVQELLRPSWPERGILARASTKLRKKARAPIGCFD